MADPERLSSAEVYARLVALAGELEGLSSRCWSVAGSRALLAASKVLRGLATTFFVQL